MWSPGVSRWWSWVAVICHSKMGSWLPRAPSCPSLFQHPGPPAPSWQLPYSPSSSTTGLMANSVEASCPWVNTNFPFSKPVSALQWFGILSISLPVNKSIHGLTEKRNGMGQSNKTKRQDRAYGYLNHNLDKHWWSCTQRTTAEPYWGNWFLPQQMCWGNDILTTTTTSSEDWVAECYFGFLTTWTRAYIWPVLEFRCGRDLGMKKIKCGW